MKTEWLLWLAYFNRYGSLQKVSEECHVTPQNIGKMFGHLEEELGVTLFEKQGKNIRLTPAGKELAHIGEGIIDTLEQFRDKYADDKDRISGTMKLVSSSSQLLREVLTSYQRRYPDVTVQYQDVSFEEALQTVKNNADVMAFIPLWEGDAYYKVLAQYEADIMVQMLVREDNCILVSEKSAFANMKLLSVKDLKNRKIISLSKNTDQEASDDILNHVVLKKQSPVKLDVVRTNSESYFESVVRNGLALGMGLYSNCRHMENNGIRIIRLIDDEYLSPCIWSLVYHKNKKFSACDKAFVRALEHRCALYRKDALLSQQPKENNKEQ